MIYLCIYIMSNSDPLADAVRNWVHFDNLHLLLSKQVNSALDMKNTFEQRIFDNLGKTKQIKTATVMLEPATRNEDMDMSLTSLEDLLHKYYLKSKKPDETEKIIDFIKKTKQIKSEKYIKKLPL